MKMVTVIITTYGEPTHLEKTIMSVANQTYKNIQLVVVDDNEMDSSERFKTENLINLLSKRTTIEYYKHETNLNGAYARNTGLKFAKGYYVSFLDSDDFYKANRIEVLVRELDKPENSIYDGAYTGCDFYRNNNFYKRKIKAKSGNFLFRTLCTSFNFYSGSNIFIKKTVFDDLKGFDTSFVRHQDYEFLVRYFLKHQLLGVNKVLLVKNNENKNLPSVEKVMNVKKLYLKKYSDIIHNFSKSKQRKVISSNNFQIIEMYIVNKNIYKALTLLMRNFFKAPLYYLIRFPLLAFKMIKTYI